MSILANELRTSSIGAAISHIVVPASMMTALDMHGFSLTLYPLDATDADLLGAEARVRAWPGIAAFKGPIVVPIPAGLGHLAPVPSASPAHEALLRQACKALVLAEADLNLLDAKSGDGDTGSTLAGACRALLSRIDTLPLADFTQLHRAIRQELGQSMGGSSGVLLAIFFTATGDALSRGLSLIAAFEAGLARMQEVGGAKPGDRTMIDALHPALQALPGGLAKAAAAARAGANLTATMSRALAGRATYVSAEHLGGHIDPGAEAVARLFEHLRDSVLSHADPDAPAPRQATRLP